jgi:hypothetical protein
MIRDVIFVVLLASFICVAVFSAVSLVVRQAEAEAPENCEAKGGVLIAPYADRQLCLRRDVVL